MIGKVVSISISRKKGTPKKPVMEAILIEDHGIQDDAHAGPWHRQVSFLAEESISSVKQKGLDVDFGVFAENIATSGIDWQKVTIGSRVFIGKEVIIEITQIGKECHNPCAIYYRTGDCIMPREGVFGRVIKGGKIVQGDTIKIVGPPPY